MRLCHCSFLTILLLATATSADASSWYPIETGLQWMYSGNGGATYAASFQPPETFAGALTQPLEWDSGVRDYYSEDGSGRVLYHGVRFPDGSYVVFDPPVLHMDSDLAVGQQWESTYYAVLYDAGGTELDRAPASSTIEVLAIGPVSVAAGDFTGAEILRTEDTGLFRQESATPGVTSPGPVQPGVLAERRIVSTFRDTYAEGIGWILRTNANGGVVIFELEDYANGGVRAGSATWSALKSAFGN